MAAIANRSDLFSAARSACPSPPYPRRCHRACTRCRVLHRRLALRAVSLSCCRLAFCDPSFDEFGDDGESGRVRAENAGGICGGWARRRGDLRGDLRIRRPPSSR